ncbi:MAG: glutamate--tRNA ligase family protein, partial [Pseudomonadota bacterium]
MKEKPETNLPIESVPSNFIRNIIDEDNRTGKWNGRVETRFPPEPNGYLHIGHAKSICNWISTELLGSL